MPVNGSRSVTSVSSFWFAPCTRPSEETMPKPFGIQTCPAMSFASICAGSVRLPRRVETRTRSPARTPSVLARSEEHTSELQSLAYLVCRLLLEKKKKKISTEKVKKKKKKKRKKK